MAKAKTGADTTASSTAEESLSESGRSRDEGGADPFEIVFRFVEKIAKPDDIADALDLARTRLLTQQDTADAMLLKALYRIMNGEQDPRSIAAEALAAPSSFVEHLKHPPETGDERLLSSMRGDAAGVDMATSGSDAAAFATFNPGTGEVLDVRVTRSIPLWCPHCGKPHVDRGEWATRPHHKHLCHDDVHGKGCGKLFRIGESGSSEYAFGAAPEPSTSPSAFDLDEAFEASRDAWHAIFGRNAAGEDVSAMFVRADEQMLLLKTRIARRLARRDDIDARVRDFFAIAGQATGERPHVPSEPTVRFRARLIAEEFVELMTAIFAAPSHRRREIDRLLHEMIDAELLDVNLPDVIDACADLDYVLAGLRVAFGVDGEPIGRLVHAANMAKQGGPIRESDGKRLKPPGWKPPDVEGELRRQGWIEPCCYADAVAGGGQHDSDCLGSKP